MREYLHAKIHRATVTQADLNYIGSITIDAELLKKCDVHVGQKVLVTDRSNWSRLETYVIAGEKWEICMNWPTAHLVSPWDKIIIMWFELSNKPIKPKVLLVDNENNFLRYLSD